MDSSGSVQPIPEAIRADMRGRSWQEHPDCPSFEALALLRLEHWGFDGEVHAGELVVAASVADEVLRIFREIFAARFSIGQMTRIDAFDGDDARSMAANNASAFNFRRTPSGSLSQHAFGTAIDINPVQNPMIIDDTFYPPAGEVHGDRSVHCAGMIVRPGPVVAAFDAAGWSWGGDWTRVLDYHHFSKSAE